MTRNRLGSDHSLIERHVRKHQLAVHITNGVNTTDVRAHVSVDLDVSGASSVDSDVLKSDAIGVWLNANTK